MTDKEEMAEEVKETGPLLRYLQEGPIKAAITLAITCGGLIVLTFYTRHEFMPQAGLDTLTSIFAAVALTGLFIVLVLSFIPVFPSILSTDEKKTWEKRKNSFLTSLAIGSLFFLIFLAQGFFHAKPELGDWSDPTEKNLWLSLVFISTLLCSIPLCLLGWCHKNRWKLLTHARTWKKLWRVFAGRFVKFSNWLSVAYLALVWLISLLVGSLIAFLSLPEDYWQGLAVYICWLSMVVIANFVIAGRHRTMKRREIVLTSFMPIFILITSGTLFSNLTDAPFRMLGLGLIDAGRVTISDKYAGAVERAFGPLSPNPFGSQDAEHVCIVSRIGGEYLMAAGTCENYSKAKSRAEDRPPLPARVWLPGEAVLSWSREPVKSAKNSHDDKSVKPVAHANEQVSRGN